MPRSARRRQIDEKRVGTYHCSSRCVRRSSFRDRTAGGLELDHRQEWIAKRLRAITQFFAIDLTDFGIIDNEFHAVLRNRPDLAAKLSAEQVIRRWYRMSRQDLELKAEIGSKLLKQLLRKREWVAELRRRLSSISWLMIMLKEPIARAANAEDGVRGHFFGERFSSVELEDDEQRLATSLQINSLPVRAGLACDLASSRFTAAHARQTGDGDWMAGELDADGSQSPPASPKVDEAPESEASVKCDQAVREAAAIETASNAVRSDAARRSPLFNRLPLDVYLDWLEANVVSARADAALKTAALELPVELPPAWLRYGLDVTKWSDAVEIVAPRFRWMAEVAAAMRRDCRRFVADASPPAR
ncbi:MAG: hypothetical protein RLY70_252 [Planctomycetota bacterium]|jgi:hypothetical protein